AGSRSYSTPPDCTFPRRHRKTGKRYSHSGSPFPRGTWLPGNRSIRLKARIPSKATETKFTHWKRFSSFEGDCRPLLDGSHNDEQREGTLQHTALFGLSPLAAAIPRHTAPAPAQPPIPFRLEGAVPHPAICPRREI